MMDIGIINIESNLIEVKESEDIPTLNSVEILSYKDIEKILENDIPRYNKYTEKNLLSYVAHDAKENRHIQI